MNFPIKGFFLFDSVFRMLFVFRKGSDAGDHPPITPMKSASESALDHDSWRLYDYITRHFIATVSIVLHTL